MSHKHKPDPEVQPKAERRLLDALNDFQAQHKPPMVVCSRVTDYESLPQKLNLKSAILLAPLSQSEVDEFLTASSLTRLKTLATSDAVVGEMSRNPFLLNTMAYAYDDANPDLEGMSKPRDPTERREHLFDAYIRRRFAESPRQPYDLDDTLRYLRFLAKNMQAYSQTIFRPELIDVRWLGEALPGWMEKDNIEALASTFVFLLIIPSLFWLIFGITVGAAWWVVLLLMLLGPLASGLVLLVAALVWGHDDFLKKRPSPPRILALISIAAAIFLAPLLLGLSLWQGVALFLALFNIAGLPQLLREGIKQLVDALPTRIEPTIQRLWIAFRLRLQKHIPFNLQAFINFTVSLKIMRPYGGGFVFAHRYLRETLAGLDGAVGLAKRAAKDKEALAQLVEMNEQTPEILISLLKHADAEVRWGAAKALDKLEWKPQTQEYRIAYLIATRDWEALVQIGASAVEPLIASLRDGDANEAIADYSQAIALAEQRGLRLVELYRARGDVHNALGRFAEAEADYAQALALKPENPATYFQRGRMFYERAEPNYEAALADFDQAVQLSPDESWHYHGRGLTYYKLSRYAEALADFDRAIQLNPDNELNHYWRGLTYYELSRYAEALADFDRAIQLNPDDSWHYHGRGLTYYELSRYAEALVDFDRAIQLNPDNELNHYWRGLIYLSAGAYPAAIADLQTSLDLTKAEEALNLSFSTLWLGVAQQLQGQHVEAAAALAQAQQHAEACAKADERAYALVICHLCAGDFGAARTQAQAALEAGLADWRQRGMLRYARKLAQLYSQNVGLGDFVTWLEGLG